jgi:hypothetical protein
LINRQLLITVYKYDEYECVYGALNHIYGYDKEFLFKEYINVNNIRKTNYYFEQFNIKSGVSFNKLLYLAQKLDITLYGLDWNRKLFIKYLSKNN